MTKRNQDFSKDILSLIRRSVSPAVLSERLQDFHENDLAEVLRELSAAERSRLYRILESSMLADVFDDINIYLLTSSCTLHRRKFRINVSVHICITFQC